MPVTLLLRFADRPECELALTQVDPDGDPWELLKSSADANGRIRLGDRETCSLDEVVDVTFVEPRRVEGPGWERGLQDEDAATALEEGYEPPQ